MTAEPKQDAQPAVPPPPVRPAVRWRPILLMALIAALLGFVIQPKSRRPWSWEMGLAPAAFMAPIAVGMEYARQRAGEVRARSRPPDGPPEGPFELRDGETVVHARTSAYGGWAALTLTNQRLFIQTTSAPDEYGERYGIPLDTLLHVSKSKFLPDGWDIIDSGFGRSSTPMLLLHFKDGGHRLVNVWRLKEWVKVIEVELAKNRSPGPDPSWWPCGCWRDPDPA